MELSAILELKQQILADTTVRYHDRERYDTPAQAFLAQAPEKRLAVGYSKRVRGDYRLEIRVQRWDQSAFRLARQIQQQVAGEANIEVIPRIQIPPKTALLAVTEGRQTPVLEKPGPLQIGISVGHRDGGAGTLGAFVGTPDGAHLLSCNHVLARLGNASIGAKGQEPDFVYHPGREKGVRLGSKNRIAQLSAYVDLSRTHCNHIDCALARILPDWDHDINRIPPGHDFPGAGGALRLLDDLDRLDDRTRVAKIGRSTGYTRGFVNAVDLDNVPVWTPAGNLLFNHVIEIVPDSMRQPFSSPGDSGSQVFTTNGLHSFGLLFAGGKRDPDGLDLSFCCSLSSVLEALDADLLES